MTERTQTKAAKAILRSGLVNDASELAHTETFYKVVDVSANDTEVYGGPCLLMGVYVNTALSAHTCPIKDGGTSGTTVVTLPASWTAGSMANFPGIRFETTLHVDPNDSGTGNITVAYRPI